MDRSPLGRWTTAHAEVGSFAEALEQAPPADLTRVGLPHDPAPAWIERIAAKAAPCLLLRGSGNESILA